MANPNLDPAKALSEAASKYVLSHAHGEQEQRAALEAVEAALREVRRVRFGEAASPIGAFFADIGQGVVTAQKQLDRASEEYVQGLLERRKKNDPEARGEVPGAAVFRIPRVSAELKLSLEKSDDRSWNVVFYSKGHESREVNEQSLQFEIVSVPAPPGYTEFLDHAAKKGGEVPAVRKAGASRGEAAAAPALAGEEAAPGRGVRGSAPHFEALPAGPEPARRLPERADAEGAHWPFYAGEERRREVREALPALAKGMAPAQRRRVQQTLLRAWDRAIVLAADEHCSFVVLAREGKRPELILWQVVTQPASLVELYRMPAAARTARELERLRELLIAIGAAGRR